MSQPSRYFLTCDAQGRNWFRVEIHPTEESMHVAIERLSGKCENDSVALCLSYEWVHEGKLTGELGTLFFHRNAMGPEVVAHELGHAALSWAKRRRVDPRVTRKRASVCPQEKFCEVLQRLTGQLYQKAGEQILSSTPIAA